MMKRQALVAVAFAVLLSAGAFILLVPSEDYDPLAEFRNETGGISIPGGEFTPELQRLLFGSGPSPSTEYTVWRPKAEPYPTMLWEGHTMRRTNPGVYTPSPTSPPLSVRPSDLLKPVIDGFRWFFSFDWLIGTASAVDRFAVYGDVDCTGTPNPTALATDADCWSTTSGGSTAGLPVAADNLIFDSGTGAGTGTFDASLNITTGTVTTCSAAAAPIAACAGAFTGTFALATFTLTNTGTIVHDGGTITSGTGGIDGHGGRESGDSLGAGIRVLVGVDDDGSGLAAGFVDIGAGFAAGFFSRLDLGAFIVGNASVGVGDAVFVPGTNFPGVSV